MRMSSADMGLNPNDRLIKCKCIVLCTFLIVLSMQRYVRLCMFRDDSVSVMMGCKENLFIEDIFENLIRHASVIDQWSKDASDGVCIQKTLSIIWDWQPIKVPYMLSDADAGEVWQAILTFFPPKTNIFILAN